MPTYAVDVYTSNDEGVCEACQELANKAFLVKNTPEMPYEKCTSEGGCRCWTVPTMNEKLHMYTKEEVESENWFSEKDKEKALKEWAKMVAKHEE